MTVTVLFVEDDPDLRDVIAYELDLAGFKVLTAGTGEEALEILRERPGAVDWLFTDIRLPGLIDGWRVADEFRFTYPLRPVIFATGAAQERSRDMIESLFMRKPYRASEIVSAFHVLREGWFSCGDDVEALRHIKQRPLGPKLSWAPPGEEPAVAGWKA
ncbi:response regulator [Salinarimonas soli]|uniref:Response regulator n=1 Tax=Salinarimonas soli TaxID=1638099 RepID=A0A5B2VZZ9_9HYPH|nr:response regulator [Salinarimonas soli]